MPCLAAVVNNTALQQHKLWALTNSSANAALIAVISLIILKKWCKAATALAAGHAVATNLALSNTLFCVHPVLLVLGLVTLAARVREKRGATWPSAALTSLAVFLGGFWSTQELNWGG